MAQPASRIRLLAYALPICGSLGCAAPALAEQVERLAATEQSSLATTSPFAVKPVPTATLRGIAGRENLAQQARSDHVATVTRNSIGDNSETGDAAISDNAFQNLSGMSVVNVNTGNNVAVNSAINVTISLTPAP